MPAQNRITKSLLETALKTFHRNDNLVILEVANTNVVPRGENYASDLFRTVITYKSEENKLTSTTSVIIKCSPNDEVMKNLVKEMHLFEKEASIFTETLPLINKILESEDLSFICGKCIYTTFHPQIIVIFEDLSVSGFKMLDRQKGLDLKHTLFTVENIAKLHAGSLLLYEKHPYLIEKYEGGLFLELESIIQWIESGFRSLIKACAKWPGFEKYGIKLKVLNGKLANKVVTISKPKQNGFNVLNHGDAWINNFMYSYTSGGKLKDFRFVDFQHVIHSSPVLDLHFFWVTSPTVEVKMEHFDNVISHYHEMLMIYLKKLNYPSIEAVPTKAELLQEWKLRAFYGLLVSVTSLPLIKATPTQDASFDHFMEHNDESSFRYNCYNNQNYKECMEFLLPYYNSLGALDF